MNQRLENPKYALLGDVPVGEHAQTNSNKDGLNRQEVAKVLARSSLDTEDTLTIGVYGDWGDGKTSLMRLIKAEVDKSDYAVGVWFNAWQYEREDHLIVPLIATISNALKDAIEGRHTHVTKLQESFLKGTKALGSALQSVAYGFSFKGKVDIPLLAGAEVNLSGKDMIERYQELTNEVVLDRSLYFDAFEKLHRVTSGSGSDAVTADGIRVPKIILFIDDLDRCAPEAAVRLLESIKLVLGLPRFAFVLGIAPKVIQAFVRQKFSKDLGLEQEHFENYLDKFVQVPFDLSSVAEDTLTAYVDGILRMEHVFSEEERKEFDEVKGVLAHIGRGNPRSIIRFINLVLVRRRIANAEERPIRVAHLAFAAVLGRLQNILIYGEVTYPQANQESEDAPDLKWLSEVFLNDLEYIEQFGGFLWAMIRRCSPSDPAQKFIERIRSFAQVQRDSAIKEAMVWLSENTHICKALNCSDGEGWLNNTDAMKASFRTTRLVQAPQPGLDRDENLIWENAEKAVRDGVDPLTIQAIQDLLRAGRPLPAFARPHVKNVRALSDLLDLSRLDLSECEDLDDLSTLARLTNLSHLFLRGCVKFKSISPLVGLTSLVQLYLGRCEGLTDIDGVSMLRGLRVLELNHCVNLIDINGLVNSYVAVLSLQGCQKLVNIGPLASTKNLSRLDLRFTAVKDIEALTVLHGLEFLYLEATPISNVASLRTLTNLRLLDLTATLISDVEPLHTLHGLVNLSLKDTRVDSISHLEGLAKLQELDLRGTSVVDLSPIEKNTVMAKLHVTMIPGMESALAALSLSRTDIQVIKYDGDGIEIAEDK